MKSSDYIAFDGIKVYHKKRDLQVLYDKDIFYICMSIHAIL